MHVISLKKLRDFWQQHPSAESVLRRWHTVIENVNFKDFLHIKALFNSADYVPPYVIFDIAGNHYRIIVVVQYSAKRMYVREVMTHAEYDQWCKRYQKGKV
jgi:mRNA interferase HigB